MNDDERRQEELRESANIQEAAASQTSRTEREGEKGHKRGCPTSSCLQKDRFRKSINNFELFFPLTNKGTSHQYDRNLSDLSNLHIEGIF
jgi:hypothetical protein